MPETPQNLSTIVFKTLESILTKLGLLLQNLSYFPSISGTNLCSVIFFIFTDVLGNPRELDELKLHS